MRRVSAIFLVFAIVRLVQVSSANEVMAAELPQDITLRELLADPGLYDCKLIRVTGVVSHAFEDFTLGDPTLVTTNAVWLEYGGWVSSDTIYCCGPKARASRREVLTINNIRIPLKKDKQFRRFDRLLKRKPESVVRATIVGRFFAGERTTGPNGDSWRGYGHFGCCSLLVIQQVRSVEKYDTYSKTSPN
jgi:hypothetical protein